MRRYCRSLPARRREARTATRSTPRRRTGARPALQNKEAATHFLTTVKQIEATAPEEVKSEWVSLESLFATFTVDKPDLTAVSKRMQDVEGAAKKIETHAKETCGIDLAT